MPLVLASLSGLPALAQSDPPLAGSPGFTALAPQFLAGSVWTSSASRFAEVLIGAELPGSAMASAQYTAQTPSLAATDLLLAGPPIVLGTVGGQGAAEGGVPVELIGAQFSAGTPPAITFDGVPGGAVQVLSDTRLLVAPPPGLNAFGNPLGEVSVGASNNLGQTLTPKAFVYAPALRESDPGEVEGNLGLQFVAQPGTLGLLYAGGSIPGVAVPIAGVAGALELTLGTPAKLTQGTAGANGVRDFGLPVPANPGLAGTTVDLQALSVQAVPTLSLRFTNRLPVLFLP